MKNLIAAVQTPDPCPGCTLNQDVKVTNPILSPDLQNLLKSGGGAAFVASLVSTLVTLIFIFGSIYFFFQLALAAVEWIGSGGDKGKVEIARGKITSALIGLIILFSVYAIVSLIQSIFGVNILTLDISKLIIR